MKKEIMMIMMIITIIIMSVTTCNSINQFRLIAV